jgi:AraC-like DNA-binding protein
MSAAYFGLILRGCGRDDPRWLLEGTDVSASALPSEITLAQQLVQVRNAGRRLGPAWALSLQRSLHAAAHGPMGLAVASAPTVEAGIETMGRYSHVRSPHFDLIKKRHDDEVRLVPHDRVALDEEVRGPLLDIVMLSTQHLLESALGRPLTEGRFEYPGPAPRRSAAYGRAFRSRVFYGCDEPAIVLPASFLSWSCPLADAPAFEMAVERLEAGALRLRSSGCVAARVEHLFRTHEMLTLTQVARALAMSRRSLMRHLEQEGTTFRDLLDAHRRRRARTLLAQPSLPIAEVAWRLGYQDAANFGRACRRWFGRSPGRLREELSSRH